MPNPSKPKQGPVPIDALVNILDEFGDGFVDEEAGQAFARVMNVLEAKAVELAPVDTGNLESSTVVRVEKDGATNYIGTLRFAAQYATVAHERPDESRGPKTRSKPGNEYGLAGPKYLERPLLGFQRKFEEDMGAALQEYWGGKSGTTGGKKAKKGKK